MKFSIVVNKNWFELDIIYFTVRPQPGSVHTLSNGRYLRQLRSEAGLGCHRARKLRHVVLLFWMFSGDGDCVPFRTARRPFIHTAVEFFPNVYRLAVK